MSTLLLTNGNAQEVIPRVGGKWSSTELQRLVRGNWSLLNTRDGRFMVVNTYAREEDAGLKLNERASNMVRDPGSGIFGTAVVVRSMAEIPEPSVLSPGDFVTWSQMQYAIQNATQNLQMQIAALNNPVPTFDMGHTQPNLDGIFNNGVYFMPDGASGSLPAEMNNSHLIVEVYNVYGFVMQRLSSLYEYREFWVRIYGAPAGTTGVMAWMPWGHYPGGVLIDPSTGFLEYTFQGNIHAHDIIFDINQTLPIMARIRPGRSLAEEIDSLETSIDALPTKEYVAAAIEAVETGVPPDQLIHFVTQTELATALTAKLNLAGGTLTGFLSLPANPSSESHAVRKDYVDTGFMKTVGDIQQYVNQRLDALGPAQGALPLTGGTLTGDLHIDAALSVGLGNTTTGDNLASGHLAEATGWHCAAIGGAVEASDGGSIALGIDCRSHGYGAIAMGHGCEANGDGAVAEGHNSGANHHASHCEGGYGSTNAEYSHAEGGWCHTFEYFAHAEGDSCEAYGFAAHAEGDTTFARGYAAHAGGTRCRADSHNSFAHGQELIGDWDNEFVIGRYNEHPGTPNAFIIGNGTADNDRRNCFRVDWDGHVYAEEFIIGQHSKSVNKWIEALENRIAELEERLKGYAKAE